MRHDLLTRECTYWKLSVALPSCYYLKYYYPPSSIYCEFAIKSYHSLFPIHTSTIASLVRKPWQKLATPLVILKHCHSFRSYPLCLYSIALNLYFWSANLLHLNTVILLDHYPIFSYSIALNPYFWSAKFTYTTCSSNQI